MRKRGGVDRERERQREGERERREKRERERKRERENTREILMKAFIVHIQIHTSHPPPPASLPGEDHRSIEEEHTRDLVRHAATGHLVNRQILLAGVGSVDTLGLVGNGLLELRGGAVVIDGDPVHLHLHQHLIVLVARLLALVLTVGLPARAAPVIHDSDDRREALLDSAREGSIAGGHAEVSLCLGLGGAEERGGDCGSGAGLYDFAPAQVHGHHRREGGGRASHGQDGGCASDHGAELRDGTRGQTSNFYYGQKVIVFTSPNEKSRFRL